MKRFLFDLTYKSYLPFFVIVASIMAIHATLYHHSPSMGVLACLIAYTLGAVNYEIEDMIVKIGNEIFPQYIITHEAKPTGYSLKEYVAGEGFLAGQTVILGKDGKVYRMKDYRNVNESYQGAAVGSTGSSKIDITEGGKVEWDSVTLAPKFASVDETKVDPSPSGPSDCREAATKPVEIGIACLTGVDLTPKFDIKAEVKRSRERIVDEIRYHEGIFKHFSTKTALSPSEHREFNESVNRSEQLKNELADLDKSVIHQPDSGSRMSEIESVPNPFPDLDPLNLKAYDSTSGPIVPNPLPLEKKGL